MRAGRPRVGWLRLRQQLREHEGRCLVSSPIACTLPDPEMRERLAATAALAQRALLSHEQDGSTLRLRYASDAADELEELVAGSASAAPFSTSTWCAARTPFTGNHPAARRGRVRFCADRPLPRQGSAAGIRL
jgi:hypothetical protein